MIYNIDDYPSKFEMKADFYENFENTFEKVIKIVF